MRWVGKVAGVALVCGSLGLTSCGPTRDSPVRFRNPLVGGVSAAALPDRSEPADRRPIARTRRGNRTRRHAPPPRRDTRARQERLVGLAAARPNPLRARPAGEPIGLADVLRGLVGQRDPKGSDVAFAARALRAIGSSVSARGRIAGATSGRALVSIAESRQAIDRPGPALLGDLLVFDGVVGRERSSLVAVVVSRRADDTVEFVYLTRGVVRRGYVNPSYPSQKRGPKGRARNTFVRHSNGGDARGTRYLAGHLLARIIRLDRLADGDS